MDTSIPGLYIVCALFYAESDLGLNYDEGRYLDLSMGTRSTTRHVNESSLQAGLASWHSKLGFYRCRNGILLPHNNKE